MISPNIDLTENRDFGNAPVRFRIRQFRDGLADMENPIMTRDEYDALCWWEGLFGHHHKNEKERIFDYERKHYAYWKETCVRCGHPLRLPWINLRGVCQDCDMDLKRNQVPWKKYCTPERRHVNDIFNLR